MIQAPNQSILASQLESFHRKADRISFEIDQTTDLRSRRQPLTTEEEIESYLHI